MKLSEYVKNLQELLEEEGDLECYYSVDSEGNGYCRLVFSGTLMYTDELKHRLRNVSSEEDEDNNIPICVVN